MRKHNINWHSAFISGMQIELEPWQDILTFESEYLLNRGIRRADLLIIKAPENPPPDTPIARHFRQYNVIDYKGPGESMNTLNFFKALSYACSLPDLLHETSAAEELTLTLVTHHFPRRFAAFLRKKFSQKTPDVLEKIANGIYDIHIDMIPVRLVVLPELSPEEYLWLRCLTNHLTPDTPLEALAHAYQPHQDTPTYQNFLNAVIRANQISKGDELLMCEALYELFADELKKNREEGSRLGRLQMAALIPKLIAAGRESEIEKAARDEEYCEKLMEEMGV